MNEPAYHAVMRRLAAQLGAQSDADLARALGMSPSDLGNRKRRGSVPWERIASLAAARQVQMDALIGGGGVDDDAGSYAVRRGPDCPEYRAAVGAVLDGMERAGVALTAHHVRGLLEFVAAHHLDAPGIDALIALIRPAPAGGGAGDGPT